MSSGERRMTEHELDAILRTFLRDGAESAERRIAERAMAEVRTTTQVRPPITLRWPVRVRLGQVAAASLAAVLVIALGAYVVGLPNGPAAPTSSPTPTAPPSASPAAPSPTPTDEFVGVGSFADGYSMLVPSAWVEVPTGSADARRWEGPDGSVMVSYGSSIFDGGEVTQCGPPTPEWPLCTTESYGYSIPYDPLVDGVGPLALDGYVRDRCEGGCDVTIHETTLDGEMAQQSLAVAADLRVTYVATFHDHRPVIIYWSEPASGPNGAVRTDLMRSSFRFIETPVASATPFLDPTELVPYVNEALGYELLVPRFWGDGTDRITATGVHDFGDGRGFGTHGFPALSISVGSADGTITICQAQAHDCDTVVAHRLADLNSALISVPEQFAGAVPGDEAGDIVLGGEPGRFKRPRYKVEPATPGEYGLRVGTLHGNCLGCPGMLYHAYVIRDGRPVVISIDWWTISFKALPTNYLSEMLASFRFLD